MSTQQPQTNALVTVSTLRRMKQAGEKFACLTAYDASFAAVVDQAGVDVILVGDSLGMVVQGHDTTVPVTVDDMVYHSRLVARGRRRSLLMVDMPFMSFTTPEQALHNAARLMREGFAHMVKLEGGRAQVQTVRRLSEQGVPVCAHIGLTPQYFYKLGGYRVQGREEAAARVMVEDARSLQEAGAEVLLLECIPSGLTRRILDVVTIPVIGIGAGAECDGQILVLHDMLGVTPGKRLRFTHDFMKGAGSVAGAIEAYAQAVKSREFPGPQHGFD